MESPQIIAAFVAGLAVPFVQEVLFGAKVSGRLAAVITMGTTLVIATLASWATGGFGGAVGAPAFNLIDPSAFFGFWWHIWAPVYAIAQIVYTTTTKKNGSGPVQAVADKVQPIIGTG
jgi:hypothetical protein